MESNKVVSFFKNRKSLLILFAIVTIAAVSSPRFLTVPNIQNLFLQVAIQGIVGFGMTFCLIAGEFDMSVGSVLTLAGIAFAKLIPSIGVFPAAILALALGALAGLINGTLIASLGLSSFIGTLGTMYTFKGIALMMSNGEPTRVSDPAVIALSQFKIAGFTVFPFIFILVGLICGYILMRTRFGRNIYATGGNMEAAKNSGINTTFYKIMSFVIVCVSAAFAGILLTARLQSATPIAGDELNLVVVSSIIIGGTSPAGGIGSIQKSFVGLLIMGIVSNGLDLVGISGYYQQVVQGFMTVAIIGAASFANYRKVNAL
ncbi:MAG: ABC transporter permease [Clostridia bacterium]